MTAEDAARALIARYAERGDSYESLKAGAMGSYNREYAAVIGSAGFPWCPAKTADDLTVGRLGEREVCARFSLRALYDQIKAGVRQASLF